MDVEAALESVDPNEVRGDPAGKGKHESSRAALGTLSLSLPPGSPSACLPRAPGPCPQGVGPAERGCSLTTGIHKATAQKLREKRIIKMFNVHVKLMVFKALFSMRDFKISNS